MSILASVEAEVKALVGTTWTDCSIICTQIQELQRNIITQAVQAAGGDLTKIKLPIGIIGLGKVVVDTGFGSHGDYRRLPIKFWYIATASGDTTSVQDWCTTKGEELLAAFLTGTFTTFQVLGDDRGDVDSSAEVAFADESLKAFCSETSFATGLLTLVT